MAEAMTKERQGEIALAFLQCKLRREGIRVGKGAVREFHHTLDLITKDHPDLNLTLSEFLEFMKMRTQEVADACYDEITAAKNPKHSTSDPDDESGDHEHHDHHGHRGHHGHSGRQGH